MKPETQVLPMQITEIKVHAGRKFNHPYEQFSNLSPGITLTAVLNDDDDPRLCAHQLQRQAEELVEEHRQMLLREIQRAYEMEFAGSLMEMDFPT